MVKKIILWICFLLVSSVIFGFSADTADESTELSITIAEKTIDAVEKNVEMDREQRHEILKAMHVIVRKSAHIAEFAVLGILGFLLAKSYNLSVRLCVVLSLLYCLLFAVFDEVHQLFVDGRTGKVIDVCIDFIGSFIGVMLCLFATVRKKKKKI